MPKRHSSLSLARANDEHGLTTTLSDVHVLLGDDGPRTLPQTISTQGNRRPLWSCSPVFHPPGGDRRIHACETELVALFRRSSRVDSRWSVSRFDSVVEFSLLRRTIIHLELPCPVCSACLYPFSTHSHDQSHLPGPTTITRECIATKS